jgi:O-antigen ligase
MFDAKVKMVFFVVLALGIASCINANQPLWAFTELSILLVSAGLAFTFALQRQLHGAPLDRLFIIFVSLLCLAKSLEYLAAAAAGFLSSEHLLDTDLLLAGFSNKRFYGQFQTFTLPLLALPLLSPSMPRGIKASVFCLLSVWWMIAISGGTRGTWLGMAVAISVACCLGQGGRRWASYQLAAALTGLALYIVIFSMLASLLEVEIANFSAGRLTTSLSAREILWQQAWNMIKIHPFLGAGPMHFAETWNAVAAHPHQAILQWGSEWGIPSTLCVAGLTLYGISRVGLLVRKQALSLHQDDLMRLCLFASLVGALTQAMVDGVIVMPYSQLWLAIVVGWLLGMRPNPVETPASAIASHLCLIVLTVASTLLLFTIVRDAPTNVKRQDQFLKDHPGRLLPRFWMQGIILSGAK